MPLPTPEQIVSTVERALADAFGVAPERASMTFLGVEPLEVLRFVSDDEETVPIVSYVTLGTSRHAMTGAADTVVTDSGPRAELVLQLRPDVPGAWRKLAVLGAAPAVEAVVYRAGMTLDLGEPLVPGSACTGFVVSASPIPPIRVGEEQVDVLRVLPATHNELAWSRVRGAVELEARWAAQHTDLLTLTRPGAVLD